MIGVEARDTMVLVVARTCGNGQENCPAVVGRPSVTELQGGSGKVRLMKSISQPSEYQRKRLEVRVEQVCMEPRQQIWTRAKIASYFEPSLQRLLRAQPRLAGACLGTRAYAPFKGATAFWAFLVPTDRISNIALAVMALMARLDLHAKR